MRYSTELPRVVHTSDILFIAVDTPQGEDGSADLSNVAAVAKGVGRALAETEKVRPLVVANKSTVPVGSGGTSRCSYERALTRRVVRRTTG